MRVSFSNRIESLFIDLKQNLFSDLTKPFKKRMIVVPSPLMKTWLMMNLADDPELGIAAGIEINYPDHVLKYLYGMIERDSLAMWPTSQGLALLILAKLRRLIENFSSLNLDEQKIWKPVIIYLGQNEGKLPKQKEKRLLHLSEQLSHLFFQYGKYGKEMIKKWEENTEKEWQQLLWNDLFKDRPSPYELLREPFHIKNKEILNETIELHIFAMSFLSKVEFNFLHTFSKYIPFYVYHFSPCRMYWGDIRSNRESLKIQKFWEKKGAPESQQQVLEEYLRDHNPLLGNFGRLGREMITLYETYFQQMEERYFQIEHDHYQDFYDDQLHLEKKNSPFTLLDHVLADILHLRNPDPQNKIEINSDDDSIQLHGVSSRRREVETVYDLLLGILDKKKHIAPKDILVMSPDIMDYASAIKTVFGSQESLVDFQMIDLKIPSENAYVKAFLHLLSLIKGKWDNVSLLELCEFTAFQRKNKLSLEDVMSIRSWINKTRFQWGLSTHHRKAILKNRYGLDHSEYHEMIGTLEYTLGRLMNGLVMAVPSDSEESYLMDFPPLEDIENTQGELLGKWMTIIQSLKRDLQNFHDHERSFNDWVDLLVLLAETYLEDIQGTESSYLSSAFESLRQLAFSCTDESFPFSTVLYHLEGILNQNSMTYRENQLNTIRFCSMLPMRAIPAKVIVLMGMQDGVFPRLASKSQLNLLYSQKDCDYLPSKLDFDRYLFLESLLSAREYFILTYSCENGDESSLPSLVVRELFHYLDTGYHTHGQSISSFRHIQHPFFRFDQFYFSEGNRYRTYSKSRYREALAFYAKEKDDAHRFIKQFSIEKKPDLDVQEFLVDIQSIRQHARNPIKTYLNHCLGLHLYQNRYLGLPKEEKILMNPGEIGQMQKASLKQPLDHIFQKAYKEGKVPFEPFKSLAYHRTKEEHQILIDNLEKVQVSIDTIYHIELSENIDKPHQTDSNWMLPPMILDLGHYRIKLVGDLDLITEKGLLTFVKDDKIGIIKEWPVYLIYTSLIFTKALTFDQNLIFVKNGRSREPFFDNPLPLLKRYLQYYLKSLKNPSPLIPEWLPEMVNGDKNKLDNTIKTSLASPFQKMYQEEALWSLNSSKLLKMSDIDPKWIETSQTLFGDLYRHWYPMRGQP